MLVTLMVSTVSVAPELSTPPQLLLTIAEYVAASPEPAGEMV